MPQWLKENAVTVIAWVLFIGVAYGTYKTTTAQVDQRLGKLEGYNLDGMHAQVDQNAKEIQAIKLDNRISQDQISDIKAQIGVLGQKLDNVNETLSRLDRRFDHDGGK